MSVALAQVPMRYRRTAIRHLESLRDSELAPPRSADADLASTAWPMYRPDLADVAYWEFGLIAGDGGPGVAAQGKPVSGEAGGTMARPFGFIVVSTGEHDFPIPHWSLERPPVSDLLREEAQRRGKAVARIYRLDALAYLAEDEAGEEVGRSGQMPGLPEPLAAGPADAQGSLIVRPRQQGRSGTFQEGEFAVERRGEPVGVTVTDPTGWGRLKARYAQAFGPMLADVRRSAGRAWKIDRDVEEFGEGVLAGDSFSVRLLSRGARVEVTGDGSPDVGVEPDDQRRGPPLLRGRTRGRVHEQERSFELRVTYEDGETESLRYFLVSPGTKSNARRQSGEVDQQ